MALANERGPIALQPHEVDESILPKIEGNTVMSHTMQRRHPASHHGGPVGLTDGTRHVKFIKPAPARCDGVDVRCFDYWVAITTQVVRPMLIRDDKKKIWPFSV